jgi:hypothetical protein
MNKTAIFKFAYPVKPEGSRTANNVRIIGEFTKTIPSYVFFQTTDKDGFVFPYADVLWIDELTCRVTIVENQPMAFQATCHVEGFGQAVCRTDNKGKMYDVSTIKDGDIILFDLEAAASEIEDCKKRIEKYKNEGIFLDKQLENELDIASGTLNSSGHFADAEDKLKRANKALAIALNISEQIEIERAKYRLSIMKNKRAFSFSTFMDGNFSDFDMLQNNPKFKDCYLSLFNTGAVSMFWYWTQPKSANEFDWSIIDKQFNWIEKNNLDGIGHCLGWLSFIPDWLKVQTDAKKIAGYMETLAEKTIERYGHFVRLWSLMNESHDWFHELNLPYEDRVSIFKTVKSKIKKIAPESVVESDSGGGVTALWKMVKKEWVHGPLEWYQSLDKNSTKDYVMGIQIYHGAGEYATFDMGRLAKQIEFYSNLGHPLHIYAQTPAGRDPGSWGEINGSWHGQWSEINQAQWWEDFLTIALSFKQVKGITAVTCVDSAPSSWMGYGGFYRSDFSAKPAVNKIQQVLEKYTQKEKLVIWGD